MVSETALKAIAGALTVLLFYLIFIAIDYFARKKGISDGKRPVRICPKCGSLEIDRKHALPGLSIITGKETFECADCGHEGMVPVVDEKDIEEFRRNLKK